jgi:AraC-like DNA-binding protein
MPRVTPLDKQWEELMALCRQEAQLQTEQHPKLLKFVSQQIDQLAREMGFTDKRITTREFRAERDGRHIVRVATD